MARRKYIGVVTFLLYACLLLQLGGVQSQWSVDQLALDFCNYLAPTGGTRCTCVDTIMIPGQGNNLCGYNAPLPLGTEGLKVLGSAFTGFSSQGFKPSTLTLIAEVCDARNSQNTSLTCTSTGSSSVTSEETITLGVSLGEEVSLDFGLPGLFMSTIRFSITFQEQTTISHGNTVTTSSTCGPGGAGQPAGTCSVYTESYLAYDALGEGFNYESVIGGGVWMHFEDKINALALVDLPNDGSTHYYWFFSLDLIVYYGYLFNLANANQFDHPSSSFGHPVTFHGSGSITGQFIDTSTTCSVSPCT